MTRLTTADIALIAENLAQHDAALNAITGCSLRELACHATGIQEAWVLEAAEDTTIAVVPVSVGLGVITGFCEAVAAIAAHIGCKAFVTHASDVAGIAEAVENLADIVMLADDNFFVAIHHESHWFIDNSTATAKGFTAGLQLMAGGSLHRKNVLVIGCGRVAQQAIPLLLNLGSYISVYDINSDSYNSLLQAIDNKYRRRIRMEHDIEKALQTHWFILDASPAKDLIGARHIHSETCISAPGVPMGLDPEAMQKIGTRLLHDPLQIGVATMITSAIQACHAFRKRRTGCLQAGKKR